MKKVLPIAIAIVLVAMISSVAQPPPPGDPTKSPDAPIAGIEYLLGIGGLYGIKRLMKRKSSDKN